jgi:hypothetical protein
MTALEIINKYPKVYGLPPYNPQENLLCFGFECGPGWFPIIEELSAKINDLLPEDTDFQVTQVKEKFGGLCFYTNWETKEIGKLISEAEDKCAVTCERCGAPGKLQTYSWYKTTCDDCK